MNKINLSDFTETEFLEFVTRICNADFSTENEHTDAILLFKKLTEHPQGSDLIYYANSDEEGGLKEQVQQSVNFLGLLSERYSRFQCIIAMAA